MPTAPLLTPLPTSPHPSRASQMLGRMLVCRLPRSAPYVVLLCLARCGFGPILSAFGGPAHARPGDTPLANAAQVGDPMEVADPWPGAGWQSSELGVAYIFHAVPGLSLTPDVPKPT